MPTGIYKRTTNRGWFRKGVSHNRGKKSNLAQLEALNQGRKKAWENIKTRLHNMTVANKISIALLGEKNPNWRGGIYPKIDIIRRSYRYGKWRQSVLKRDGYKCVQCKAKKQLEIDHIKPFVLFEKLRFDTSNGRTLCHNCHVKTDTYGKRLNYLQKSLNEQ